jgi:hypothetical protein
MTQIKSKGKAGVLSAGFHAVVDVARQVHLEALEEVILSALE